MKRRLLSIMIVCCMFWMLVPPESAETDDMSAVFGDIPAGAYYSNAVKWAAAEGIITGYEDGNFRPYSTLTRGEAAVILTRFLGGQAADGGMLFTDVAGHWASGYIGYCVTQGIAAGYGNGLFGPEDTLTGYQWAKMALCSVGFDAETEGLSGNLWESNTEKLIKAYSLDEGISDFDGTEKISRSDACQIMYNVSNINNSAKDIPAKDEDAAAVAFDPGTGGDADTQTGIETDEETQNSSISQKLYGLIDSGVNEYAGIGFDWEENIVRSGDFIDLSSLDLEDNTYNRNLVATEFNRVFFDHPQYFYMYQNFAWYRPNNVIRGIIPIYHNFTPNEPVIEQCRVRLDEAVDLALKQVEGLRDPEEILLTLYDYLAVNNVYNWNVAADNYQGNREAPWSAYGALVEGDTVCKGIALAYKLLIDRLEDPRLECYIVFSREMDHVWNIVEINGQAYHVDLNKAINLVPSRRGHSRHPSFLISDETAREQGYRGWEESMFGDVPVCDSKKYESGWAFNNVDFPLYRRDGKYYYVRSTAYRKYALYTGRLDGGETKLSDIPVFTREFTKADGSKYFVLCSGVVWMDDNLYYVDKNLDLIKYSLSSGGSEILGRVPFQAKASQDGKYGADSDAVGLFLDRETMEILAVSRTTRMEIAKYPV